MCLCHTEVLSCNKTLLLDFIVITMHCQSNIVKFICAVSLSDKSVHLEWDEEWG